MNPTINKSIAKNKLDRILDELKSGSVYLTCSKHLYVARRGGPHADGGILPPQPNGCKDCWKAYFIAQHCLVDPDLRYENLLELEEVIHKCVELQNKGQWDFVPQRPEIKIHKDAADDQGNDKIVITDQES